jgi:hypothetical protein
MTDKETTGGKTIYIGDATRVKMSPQTLIKIVVMAITLTGWFIRLESKAQQSEKEIIEMKIANEKQINELKESIRRLWQREK